MEKVKNKETSELRSYYTELLGDLHDVGGNKMGSAKFQKWLKSIIPHLKSAASVMDLVQAVAQADPILKLVFGLVKGVLDVRNPPSGLRFEVMTIHVCACRHLGRGPLLTGKNMNTTVVYCDNM
jgi:hypothetical protein